MKKLFVIVVPVALIAVVGLGLAGIVNIPGLTPPKKAVKNANGMYGEKDDKKLAAKAPVKKATVTKVVPPKPKPKLVAKTTDPELGAESLAAVWNEIKVPELASITKNWSEDDLAKVLMHMDTGKVAKFLAGLVKGDPPSKIEPNPVRASNLSKKLQALGSVLPTADASS